MKSALIYNPYFDTLGGGEKYTIGIVKALENAGYTTVIAWNDSELVSKIKFRFNTEINSRIDVNAFGIIVNGTIFQKLNYFKQFDVVFFVSDGSIPLLAGKRTILHFQVPFIRPSLSYLDRLKLKAITQVVCNSQFTKKVIDSSYHTNSMVLYPPCEMVNKMKKEKIILSVGRFDGLLNNKRQDVLIDAFKQMNLTGWTLFLAGGNMEQTNNLTLLKKMTVGMPVEWFVNTSHQQMSELYGRASIYWHAAGFEIDELKHPEQMEHFGISTVEAQSAGAVPFVYDGGGQKEVIEQGQNGYVWQTKDELISQTLAVIKDKQNLTRLSNQAQQSSLRFSTENFENEFQKQCLS